MTSAAAARPPSARTWWQAFQAWPRPLRLTVHGGLSVLGAVLVTALMLTVLVRQPLPETTGQLSLPGLESPVTVVRDAHGIPQLYGDSLADLMRAQGFVHAQERFWEMDVRRHVTAGRMSELFGEAAVETDVLVRTLGWREVAEREVALLEPDTRQAFEAYADGVNAYLAQRGPSDLGIEYTLLRLGGLDYEPEDWSTADSLAWLKAMAWDLRGNMTDEIDRVLELSQHSPGEVAELHPPYDARRHRPIVEGGAVVAGRFDPEAQAGTRLPRRPAYLEAPGAVAALAGVREQVSRLPALLGTGDGLGSNSWVVDGRRSTTGMPLLANDPHLGVAVPGVWMQMGLHCRTLSEECPLDVSGFTFSGLPGVVIGHNADIAWGFTNLGADVSDLYLEKVAGDEWVHDGRRRALRVRRETIRVHDGEDVQVEVRATAHGPLISDAAPEYADVGRLARPEHGAGRWQEFGVSLAWTALKPAPTGDAILALNLASDWDEFREAAARFDVPSQNLVYADREGHIGYQAPGRIPIRGPGNDGYLPAEGWRADDDWTGDHVPFRALPHVLDPDTGMVVTANQQVIGGDYPYFLTDDWDQGYRAERIRRRLEAAGELSVADMLELQLDARNPVAPALVPHLLDQDLPEGYYADGQRLLAEWDFQQPADSAAAAYFNAVWRNLLALTFHDDLPESAWPDGGDRWMAVVEGLLDAPDDRWWDDAATEDEVERRDDILRRAMLEARDELTRIEARNPAEWDWGHLHQLDLEHQTLGSAGIAPLDWLLNRGDWQVGGGGALVNATAWDASEGYGVTAAPSMRMVVSLADFDDSRWINLTGVSGHPASDHYTDQTDLWVAGETLVWPFGPEAVDAAAEDTLVLAPAAEE